MTSRFLRIPKAVSLLIGLGMVAALVGCGGSSHTTTNPPPPPPAVTVTLGSFPTNLLVLSTAQITATVANDSTNAGVSWSCTPAKSCGSFSAGTSASGTAVTYTAPPAVPSSTVVITATSVASSSATASTSAVTIVLGLADGNYVFSLSGMDSRNSGKEPYFYVGAFTISGGAVTAGEQDYIDPGYDLENSQPSLPEVITGGTLTPSADGNLQITLNFTDTTIANNSGSVTLNANLVSANKALLTEYDTWASGSGELDLQSTTLAAPTGAYAFFSTGVNGGGLPLSVGGVINVDGANAIDGVGSILDINDAGSGTTNSAQAVTASTVSSPDGFGKVTWLLNTTCACITTGSASSIRFDGYMVDANHIRVIENWYNDDLTGVTGGTMLLQTGAGAFSSASVSGNSYVFGTAGGVAPSGTLDVAGILAFGANGVATGVGGNMTSNDITAQAPPGGNTISGGSFSVASTGDVTVTGATDGTFTYNLQLYLTGDGHALVISMDTNDVLGGYGWQQASSLNPGSLSGNYSIDLVQFIPTGGELDAVGAFNADGSSTLSGFVDQNLLFNGTGLNANSSISATYSTTPTNGDFTVTNGSGTFNATAYLVDNTKGVLIENDNTQLTLGYFELQ